MATITENLKKILSAVYGKDVRQAIHDSIEQCDQKVSNVYSVVNDIVGKLSTPVNYTKKSEKVWHLYTTGHPGEIAEESGDAYCECALINVEPGETYYIVTHSGAYHNAAPKVMFAINGDPLRYVAGYPEPNYGDNSWMVTAPESEEPLCLLVYSTAEYSGGIEKIQKMRI